MSVTQYIGARYVPMFAEPIDWDITKSYSPLTIVYHQGNSYTSKQSVPSGTDINNETYWALTGNYNAQIEQYRAEVVAAKTGADTANATNTTQDAQIAGTSSSGLKTLINTEHATNVTQDAQLAGTADSGLKTLITNESTARGNKDTALDAQLAGTSTSGIKTLITDETTARTTKDTSLDSQLAGTTDSGLKTLISNETTARTTKDTSLDSQLAGTSTSGLKTLITSETTARTTKDTSLDSQLAGTTDSGLKTLITNETNRATQAELGLNEKNVITIGDSYFCDEPGVRSSIVTELKTIATKWNIVNYADSGSAFTFGGAIGYTFLQQLQNAAAAQTAANVDIVIIAGGRNEAGAQDSGTIPAANLYTACASCFDYAVKTFVNAKICMFPLMYDWKAPNGNCRNALNTIEKAASDYGIWTAKGCYTWGSGQESAMYVGGNDIHPSTAGALVFAKIMKAAIYNNNPITFVNRCAIVNDSLYMTLTDGYLTFNGGLTFDGSTYNMAPKTSLPSWCQPSNIYSQSVIPAIEHTSGEMHSIRLDSTGISVSAPAPAAGLYMVEYSIPYTL